MTELTCVSLFSGVGGLDLGARAAGFDVRFACDLDSEGLSLLQQAQATPIDVADLYEAGELSRIITAAEAQAPALLIGGPPCTPWSHAGFWLDYKRNGSDPARSLVKAYGEAVDRIQPAAFIMENVPGLRFKTHRPALDAFIGDAEQAGYAVSHTILDASEHGVAQARRRLFVVGVRGGPPVDWDLLRPLPKRSAGWAIADLEGALEPEHDEQPRGKHAEALRQVSPGENYLMLTRERGHPEGLFRYRGRYWSFLLKAHPERPVPTIPAQRVTYNGPFHWTGRHLRTREMARLQGFPDSYPLSPRLDTARRHIGNAVPPPLAARVAWLVRVALAGLTAEPEVAQAAADPRATFAEVTAALPVARPAA